MLCGPQASRAVNSKSSSRGNWRQRWLSQSGPCASIILRNSCGRASRPLPKSAATAAGRTHRTPCASSKNASARPCPNGGDSPSGRDAPMAPAPQRAWAARHARMETPSVSWKKTRRRAEECQPHFAAMALIGTSAAARVIPANISCQADRLDEWNTSTTFSRLACMWTVYRVSIKEGGHAIGTAALNG